MAASSSELQIEQKMARLHEALTAVGLPHAFGGALALAWCTVDARGTHDIDLNVFVGVERTDDLLAALPAEVTWDDEDRARIERDGQQRLWWGHTPVDLFLNTTTFHEQVGDRARWERFGGVDLPFLCCADLAVFKAFFNRRKDWADLEAMHQAGALDADRVIGVLVQHLGAGDPRVEEVRSIAAGN